jgi:Family of unknown function (DUF6118)
VSNQHIDNGHDPQSGSAIDGDGDPALAFEILRGTVEELGRDLTREMTTIRKGLEAAFDQFDRQTAPVDYSADLGRIVDHLAMLSDTVQALEKRSVLRLAPVDITRAAEKGGEGLVRSLAAEVEEAKRDLVREAGILADHRKSAREREAQTGALRVAALAGFIAGIVSVLLLSHLLPFGLDTRIASSVLWQGRWSAGIAMMRAADPDRAAWLADANALAVLNTEALDKCRKAAKEASRDQKCTITVPVKEK